MLVKELITALLLEEQDSEVLVRFPESFEPVLYVGRNLISQGSPCNLVMLYRSGNFHELNTYP